MLKKTFSIIFVFVLVMSVGLLISGVPAEEYGSMSGYVSDAGGPVSGAEVILIHRVSGKRFKALTDGKGCFHFEKIPAGIYDVRIKHAGYKTMLWRNIRVQKNSAVNLTPTLSAGGRDEILQSELRELEKKGLVKNKGVIGGVVGGVLGHVAEEAPVYASARKRPSGVIFSHGAGDWNTEEYDRIYENRYLLAVSNPLSTFSIDVDTASYANVRRFLTGSSFPPEDAVRIEEMINYFDYDYPLPGKKHPFAIYTEISTCPWNKDRRLVHIGLQGKKLESEELPPSNLVFLIDVSGSMSSPDKLPLLKHAFKMLIQHLRKEDSVSLVVYAGAAGLVLPSTSGDQKEIILDAIDRLSSGGSTAGGAGLKLAYKVALENFIKEGNNRVILATDGDFNIGVSSTSELVRMIEDRREDGVFLTTLGFGTGNYKDGRMEQLADKGNGNYFYIDNMMEARKVFVHEMRGTLFTIAKDVKLQVEFNPAKVKAYRLVGYENRMLEKEDFNDDTKDAGDLGSGHTVTALYEVIPFGSEEEVPGADDLKYQETRIKPEAFKSPELMTIKLRYKKPDGEKSRLIVHTLIDKGVELKKSSDNFRFSAAVAQFGLLLRDSEFKGNSSFENILSLAKKSKGVDSHGYRAEFIRLVELSSMLEKQ